MDNPNINDVQIGAIDAIVRSIILTMDDAQFKRFNTKLNQLLDGIKQMNTHEHIEAHREAIAIAARAVAEDCALDRRL